MRIFSVFIKINIIVNKKNFVNDFLSKKRLKFLYTIFYFLFCNSTLASKIKNELK